MYLLHDCTSDIIDYAMLWSVLKGISIPKISSGDSVLSTTFCEDYVVDTNFLFHITYCLYDKHMYIPRYSKQDSGIPTNIEEINSSLENSYLL